MQRGRSKYSDTSICTIPDKNLSCGFSVGESCDVKRSQPRSRRYFPVGAIFDQDLDCSGCVVKSRSMQRCEAIIALCVRLGTHVN